MARGRLIWPFIVEIAPIDTSATDSAGAYDYRNREVYVRSDGERSREEGSPYRLPCQIETEADHYQIMEQAANGNSPDGRVYIVFHFSDLEDRGLLNEDGTAAINIGDRLVAFYDYDNILVQEVGVPLYATEVQPRSFGLSSLQRNLLLVRFDNRMTGPNLR